MSATGGVGTTIDHVVGGVYRISTVARQSSVTFNQFLIDDERPTLIHTGEYGHYERIRAAISQVLDPARLAYVALLHFEGDECGGMDRFMSEAPEAQLVAGALSASLNLARFPWRYRVLAVEEGDTIRLGRHSLRAIETPHVHHWDSMMLFEETTRSLFPSDLFLQPGEQPPVVRENLGEEMRLLPPCGHLRERAARSFPARPDRATGAGVGARDARRLDPGSGAAALPARAARATVRLRRQPLRPPDRSGLAES